MLSQNDLKSIEEIFDRRVTLLETGINSRLDAVGNQLDAVENRLDAVDNQLDAVENSLDLVEKRLDTVEKGLNVVRIDLLENNVIPRLNTIEKCYVDTSKRYTEKSDQFDSAIADIAVMKLAIQKNSADIQELQMKQA